MRRFAAPMRVAALLGIVAVVSGVTGCSGGGDPAPKPTTPATISDSAPYWCGITPKKALGVVTGRPASGMNETTAPLAGDQSAVPGLCNVGGGTFQLERFTGATATKRYGEKPPVGSEPHTRRIPPDLGKGAAAGTGPQWHVYAYFGCGSTKNLFTLSVSDVAKGRDTDADLIALMRIAQQRYAKQAGCSLTASGPQATDSASADA